MSKKGFLHGLLMMACCIIPIVVLVAFLPQIKNMAGGTNWVWLIMLLCPLMHIFMMKGMMGDKGCHGQKEDSPKTESSEGH